MMNSRLIKSSPQGMKYVRLSVLMSCISLIFNIIAVFSIGFLIQKLYMRTVTEKDILFTATLICLSIAVRYMMNIKGTEYSYHASTEIKTSLRHQIYEKLLNFGLGYNSKVSTSQITQIAGEGIEQIEIYFSLYLPQLFYSLLAPVILFSFLSFFSIKVSIILLICVPLIPLSIIAVNKIAKRLLSKYWRIYTDLGDNFLDNLKGLTTLKIYQDDAYKNKEMNQDAEHFRKITMKVLTMQLNSVTIMDLIAYGGAAIGIIFALLEFQAGRISLAQVVIFVLLSGEFFIPLRLLGSYFHVAMNGVAAAGRIYQIIDMPAEEKENISCSLDKINISLKNINFSYTEDRSILKDINLTIPNGSFISLVGESGCGKSTIASLIMGFYPYKDGSILINDHELKSIDEQLMMKHFSIVKHKNYLFKGTVRSNLLMGKENASDSEMYDVLKQVDLLDFIQENGGLDLELQENGSNLSGGQAQRLALARAILHDASVYIFDEASSNIDAESEAIIFETIHKLRKHKTVILISHRLMNVVNSDYIYVLDQGRIVEHGTHRELMAQKELYYSLFQNQQELETIFHQGAVHA